MTAKKQTRERVDKLCWAAMAGDLKAVAKLLKAGASPNVGNYERNTPLTMAAIRGHLEVVRLLLDHGADPNLVDADGLPPLHWAAYYGAVRGGKPDHPLIVALLLERGADPDHANKWGVTPRQMARHGDAALKKLFPKAKRRAKKDEWKARRAPTVDEFNGTPIPHTFWTDHAALWDKLVPPSGPAKTVQGEVIRVTGKLGREAFRNGNMNWDKDCTALWRFVAKTLDDADTFSAEERKQVKEWVKEIIRDCRDPDTDPGNPYDRVTEMAVRWALAHPKPIRHTPDPRIGR